MDSPQRTSGALVRLVRDNGDESVPILSIMYEDGRERLRKFRCWKGCHRHEERKRQAWFGLVQLDAAAEFCGDVVVECGGGVHGPDI